MFRICCIFSDGKSGLLIRIVIDENVSYGVVERLRMSGHDVIAIAEMPERGMTDEDVYALAMREEAVLVTRDFHFTNLVRVSAEKTETNIYGKT